MLLIQFLNIIPIVIFLQLAGWVWYIDKQSVVNGLLSACCFLMAIENTLLYCNVEHLYNDYFIILFAVATSIWGILYSLILYYLILFVEHPILSQKRWFILISIANLPIIISPLFTIPIYSGKLQEIAPYLSSEYNSPFTIYYDVLSFSVVGLLIYLLAYARFRTTSYRIQKQATLVSRAFVFALVAIVPQLMVWCLNQTTSSYLLIYPELVLFIVVVYAMSKYRVQSLSTANLVSEMIEHSSELTMVVSPKGQIISVNNHVERFLGFKKSEIENSMFFDLVQDDKTISEEFKKIEDEPNYTPYLDLPIRMNNGSFLAIRVGITAIRNKFRETLGYYFVFYAPVEEVKQLEDLQTRFGLSSREKEVAMLLTKGMSNQEIADQLYISLSTVKTHTNNIYRKTSATNRLELKKAIL